MDNSGILVTYFKIVYELIGSLRIWKTVLWICWFFSPLYYSLLYIDRGKVFWENITSGKYLTKLVMLFSYLAALGTLLYSCTSQCSSTTKYYL